MEMLYKTKMSHRKMLQKKFGPVKSLIGFWNGKW